LNRHKMTNCPKFIEMCKRCFMGNMWQ
jgi:hypothetical protein